MPNRRVASPGDMAAMRCYHDFNILIEGDQGVAHVILDRLGKRTNILAARSDPDHRL